MKDPFIHNSARKYMHKNDAYMGKLVWKKIAQHRWQAHCADVTFDIWDVLKLDNLKSIPYRAGCYFGTNPNVGNVRIYEGRNLAKAKKACVVYAYNLIHHMAIDLALNK